MEWLQAAFRWVHVVAGILWIGHLYFFNFVNGQVAKTYDADTRKKVVPELMPRALYWFRWGAAFTWVTGFLLAGMVYWSVDNLVARELLSNDPVISQGAGVGIAIALIVLVFFVYEAVWKIAGKNETVGVVVLYLVFLVAVFGLSKVFTGRAVYVHTGIAFGTIMAMNVWMRIWPAQKKIIQGVKGVAPAPDPSVPAMATLRSKHNTYMSVPLVFTMVSNHYPTIYGADFSWAILAAIVLLGLLVTKGLYGRAASAAPSYFGAPAAPAASAPPAAPKA
jgi:uncharacterized membrane protein